MEEIFVKRREAFFNNLILLGLDKPTLEKKHAITFNKDMFILPNKKGFEIVTHFLFSKLSLSTGKDYNLPWPLFGKEHDRVFQKTCCGHFVTFAEENDVKFPRIVPSVVSSFGGDRFYEVYLAFSSYVLSKTVRKNGNTILLSRPAFNRETFSICEEIMKLSTITCMQKFKDTEKVTATGHLAWTKFTKDLSECLQKQKVLLKTDGELLRKNWSIACSLYSSFPDENLTLSKIIEKNIECWQPVVDKIRTLEDFFSSEGKLWQYLASEVEEGQENQILNAQNFNLGLTDNLPEDCRVELEKVGYISSKVDEKLSVVRYIKFLIAYLKYMTDVLRKADLSKLHENCFVEDASAIQDSLLCANNLNKRIDEEIIPVVESSIQKLKMTSGFENSLENLDTSIKQFFPSIPVQSFHTEAVKERIPCFKPGSINELLCADDKICSGIPDSPALHLHKINTEKFSSINASKDDAKLPHNSVIASTSTQKEMPVADLCLLDSFKKENLPSDTRTLKVSSEDNMLYTPRITISSLADIDFAPSSFQMRESWLQEESLNAMTLSNVTLPDLSFDDDLEC